MGDPDLVLEEIKRLLADQPKLKAKYLAKRIGCERKIVNSTLHANKDIFLQDDEFFWSFRAPPSMRVEMGSGWVGSASFESYLKKAGSPLDSSCEEVIITIPDGCKLLLEASAKLLALCNQLIFNGKKVFLDFSSSCSTLSYLSRIGFIDYLAEEIQVLPERPQLSAADMYRENSPNVMELKAIDISEPDESIPEHLKNSFVIHAGEEYSQSAFTVIAELFGNVRDHSESPTPGLAALQMYKGGSPHIQTVISDNGKGIIGTLRPVLSNYHHQLAVKFKQPTTENNALLIKELFDKGDISRFGKGRGLGLKLSGKVAAQFNATISVRQEDFEVTLIYRGGVLQDHKISAGLVTLYGTHICFDFLLTNSIKSR